LPPSLTLYPAGGYQANGPFVSKKTKPR
jgi:hypothetical protein